MALNMRQPHQRRVFIPPLRQINDLRGHGFLNNPVELASDTTADTAD